MLIDITMPLQPGTVFRPGMPPVDIASRSCYHDSQGIYQTVVISLPAHSGTHVDLGAGAQRIPLERMIGPGKLLDVTGIAGRDIEMRDIENKVEIRAGDFVFFRTDWSRFFGSDRYERHPELSLEIIQWLAATEVNAVGIDAQGLGQKARHGQYDRYLTGHDVFVIENLANLDKIPKNEFTVYFFPLNIERTDAIPARVVVQTDN